MVPDKNGPTAIFLILLNVRKQPFPEVVSVSGSIETHISALGFALGLHELSYTTYIRRHFDMPVLLIPR